MTTLYLDFETYSGCDITKCGAHAYARHPSTKALMLAWAIDDGPVQLWDIAGGEDCPEVIQFGLYDGTTLSAYNAAFERLIFKHVLGLDTDISRWRCTMVKAYGLSFTGSMAQVADQFGLDINKDPEGPKLIHRFSKPQPKNHNVRRWTHENDPEGYAKFKKYCIQDVEVERALSKKLDCYHFPEESWRRYALDQEINDRGVPVDTDLIKTAIKISEYEKAALMGRLRAITGLKNPNSNSQFMSWLSDEGCPMANMQAQTVSDALDSLTDLEDPEGTIRRALSLKQEASKASVSKWKAFDRTEVDGRVRGMFQFMGASRTDRWAGRLVQLQNLARGGNTTQDPLTAAEAMLAGGHDAARLLYGRPMMLLSDTIRCAITAPEGKTLNVSDLGSIESRVLGWVTDCLPILETFAEGLDTYKVFAERLYGVPYDEVTKKMRNFSKPPVLGCGYQLGDKGLVKYADGMGVEMTEQEARAAVKTFREMYPEVPAFWKWCKDAVFYTTRTGLAYPGAHGLQTFAHGEFLFIQLPSGRRLAYHLPKIEKRKAPWKDRDGNGVYVDNFTFMGKHRFTGKWCRISATGGFLTENIVQSIAWEILCVWMERAKEAGFSIFGHVHDEIMCEEDGDRVEELNALIRTGVSWAPGLLLDADGFTTKRYRKD